MRILPLIVLVACAACLAAARPQEDAEARPASRGLLKRGLGGKGKASTTTTTAAPQEEAEYDEDAEYPAEGEAQEASTEAPASSTEGKKLVGNGVRPFRSNTDLLEALKRRRAQAAEAKHNSASIAASNPQDGQAEAPAKANYNKKRFNTATRETRAEEAPAAAPAPAKPSKSRFGRPAKSETEVEEPVEANPPTRSGRTFARRGGA